MSDLIERKKAIDAIAKLESHYEFEDGHDHLLGMAKISISALPSAQPEPLVKESRTLVKDLVKDTISRQDALDEIRKCRFVVDAIEKIKGLPPAQPEIIRCKDCKHSEFWYRDKRRCFLWHEEGIDVFEDGFCNYAERRTDDGE